MIRFDLSHILHPAGLSPRPEGLRQVTPLGAADDAPKPTHTLPNFNPARRAEKFVAHSPIQNPSPAPAGEGQGRGPSRLTPPTKKAKPMPASPNQDAVLAALQKQSPMDRAALLKATKLTTTALDQAIFILNKQKRIAKGGAQANRQYGLPGTKFLPAAREVERAPKPAKQPKPAKKPRTTGTSLAHHVTPFAQRHDELMPAARPQPVGRDGIFDVTALPCRAMKLANGGAIVLQGDRLVTELTAAQLDVVRQL